MREIPSIGSLHRDALEAGQLRHEAVHVLEKGVESRKAAAFAQRSCV